MESRSASVTGEREESCRCIFGVLGRCLDLDVRGVRSPLGSLPRCDFRADDIVGRVTEAGPPGSLAFL